MTLYRLWLRTVDQLRVALPVVVAAVLAAYTWWLVKSVPQGTAVETASSPPTLPDYILDHARVERFDAQGRRVSFMQGLRMTHHVQGDRLLVNDFYLQTQNPNGQDAAVQAWAREGRYMGAQGLVELVGQARIVASQAQAGGVPAVTTFSGEQLRWLVQEQVLSTERPVLVEGPQGTVRGSRLRYDARAGIAMVSGRVTGAWH